MKYSTASFKVGASAASATSQTAERLDSLERQLALHFRQTLLGVIEWNVDWRVNAWNPSAEAIFGYSAERRLERALIGEYEARIEGLLARLDPNNHAAIVEIAALAQTMRGFGHVKERNIVQARQREKLLLDRLDGAAQVVQ